MSRYVGTRFTSRRRHSGGGAVAYTGAMVAPKPVVATFKVEPETEGAVLCQTCDTWIMALKDGKTPKSHAAGGLSVRPARGRFPCAESGTLAMRIKSDYAARDEGLPIYTDERAQQEKLVTLQQVAHATGINMASLYTWSRQATFPQPVGLIYHNGNRQFRRLYRALALMTHPNVRGYIERQKKAS